MPAMPCPPCWGNHLVAVAVAVAAAVTMSSTVAGAVTVTVQESAARQGKIDTLFDSAFKYTAWLGELPESLAAPLRKTQAGSMGARLISSFLSFCESACGLFSWVLSQRHRGQRGLTQAKQQRVIFLTLTTQQTSSSCAENEQYTFRLPLRISCVGCRGAPGADGGEAAEPESPGGPQHGQQSVVQGCAAGHSGGTGL